MRKVHFHIPPRQLFSKNLQPNLKKKNEVYIQKYKYSSHPNTTVREQCDMQEDTVGSFAGKG